MCGDQMLVYLNTYAMGLRPFCDQSSLSLSARGCGAGNHGNSMVYGHYKYLTLRVRGSTLDFRKDALRGLGIYIYLEYNKIRMVNATRSFLSQNLSLYAAQN